MRQNFYLSYLLRAKPVKWRFAPFPEFDPHSSAINKKDTLMGVFFIYGGDEEDRTLDLTDANRTLSQLSYAPKNSRCEIRTGN